MHLPLARMSFPPMSSTALITLLSGGWAISSSDRRGRRNRNCRAAPPNTLWFLLGMPIFCPENILSRTVGVERDLVEGTMNASQ